MNFDVTLDLENKNEKYAFNEAARQANGAAWLQSGNTVVLATVVVDRHDIGSEDFVPLTVQYIEKTYAVGKIPGGFFKRETKPSDFETLTSRVVDRSLRPLFPKGYAYATQITIMVLSAEKDADLQVLALNAASAALYVSDININTSVTGIRVGKVDDKLVFNPTSQQMNNSTLDLLLAGSKDDLLMIEMRSIGSNTSELMNVGMVDPMIDPTLTADTVMRYCENAMGEAEFVEVLTQAQEILKTANTTYEETFTPFVKPSMNLPFVTTPVDEAIVAYVKEHHMDDIAAAIADMAKSERSSSLRNIREEILGKNDQWELPAVRKAVETIKRTCVREQILTEGKRADGRALTEVRPIDIQTNVLPSAHASCLFTRGQTQALVVLTLGGSKDAQMFETLTKPGTQNEAFMVHYNFPGFSVGEPSPVGPPRRRELGHGNLGKRALESSLISAGHTIRLVSEILESNGSSSMATVCGGYMALRAADVEMTAPIAGIAMGMVSEGDKYAILTDIMGLEDHDGDLDFKVAGSREGITALQMDIKLGGISLEVLKEALNQAKEGRTHILGLMETAEEAIVLNDGTLPSGDLFSIDPSSIADVIGQAGKVIREIIEKFEVAIDIDKKKGDVKVTGKSKKSVKAAREHIEKIATTAKAEKIEYHVGDIITGKVKKIVDFGAFIELPGSIDGLLHISKISDVRVENISDVLSVDESIDVEILEFKGNKISLGRA